MEKILNLNHGFLMSDGKVLDYVEICLFLGPVQCQACIVTLHLAGLRPWPSLVPLPVLAELCLMRCSCCPETQKSSVTRTPHRQVQTLSLAFKVSSPSASLASFPHIIRMIHSTCRLVFQTHAVCSHSCLEIFPYTLNASPPCLGRHP